MLFPPASQRRTNRRVVITGAGIVTALGLGWDKNAAGFRVGRSAFRPVSLFDTGRHRATVAAEVDVPPELVASLVSPRRAALMDRATPMLLISSLEAWKQTGWEPAEWLPIILGTTASGMDLGEAYYRHAVQSPLGHRGQASRALHYQGQTQGRLLAEALGVGGPVTMVSNACASGASAIGHAWELVRTGASDRVLAGGYDALSEFVFTGFDSLQALSRTVCRPFDADRDGLAIGEGAGVLALEELESAERRGARVLGELAGYGTAWDAHHLTQPHPEGEAAVAAMTAACREARLEPKDVDYVNAHGTGTPANDGAEAIAIRNWAGPRATSLPVSSTKACVGHLLGGAGAVEAVICLMVLCGQWLPPQPRRGSPDPACNFPIVQMPQDAQVDAVLSNSFGFGGVNATLALRKRA